MALFTIWKLFCWTMSQIGDVILWALENIFGLKPSKNAFLTSVEIIEGYGYPVESHKIETEDGFILTLHRIPHGKHKETGDPQSKGPILLHHGIESSSGWWLLLPPKYSLVFLLADLGYDVWLANCRGNEYSKKHLHFESTQREFWQYSFHEIGVYDLPASINYILKITGLNKLKGYIGHSMGTTVGFVCLSSQPEMNKKIEEMIALSPVAYMGGTNCLFRWPIQILPDFLMLAIMDILFVGGPTPIFKWICEFFSRICCHPIGRRLASFGFAAASRHDDCRNATWEAMSNGLGHMRSGSAFRVFVHFFQQIRSGQFNHFDFGQKRNLKIYGTMTPPSYDLSQVTCPVYAFYSADDGACSVNDVNKTLRELGNCVNISTACVTYPNFQHADFVYSEKAKTVIYDQILHLLNEPC